MSQTKSISEFMRFIKILLLGGVLGAAGVIILLLFGPQRFRGLFISTQPQLVPSTVAVSSSPEVSPTLKPDSTPSPTSSPVTQSLDQVGFEDIVGVFGEKEITQLARLGVFDKITGKFNPQQPITRAEFVRWLMRANNTMWFDEPDKIIRKAEGGKAKFTDVPATHPDFPYIQGLLNTGFISGSDEKTFRPDQPLTREQMLAIKVVVDIGGINENLRNSKELSSNVPSWKDRNQISQKFIPAFNASYFSAPASDFKNLERSFGGTVILKPQEAVTRAEAAVCLSLIGDHQGGYNHRMAEQVLQAKAKQQSPK